MQRRTKVHTNTSIAKLAKDLASQLSLTPVVTGLSVDRQGSVLVSLDNGQSWTVKDADARLNAGDAVTIRRAALGSFLMTTPSRHTYRVQRTK